MALSTEWVALKTGQSGSGGVEYSYANHILDFTEICGTFPSGVEFFVQASDAWFEGNNIYSLGSFYKAYIKLDGKLYYVSVTGGDQPLIYGEQVVSILQ